MELETENKEHYVLVGLLPINSAPLHTQKLPAQRAVTWDNSASQIGN